MFFMRGKNTRKAEERSANSQKHLSGLRPCLRDHGFKDFQITFSDKTSPEAPVFIDDDRRRQFTTVILTANRVSRIQENGIVYLARFDSSFDLGVYDL